MILNISAQAPGSSPTVSTSLYSYITMKRVCTAGTDLRGLRAPRDLVEKTFLNCWFVKLKVGNIFYFNISNYQMFFSFIDAYNL